MSFFPKMNFRVLCMEILGSFLIAVGIYNFALPAGFPMTGFSGIAIILHRLFALPVGSMTIVLNIPVALFCCRLLGKTFFLRSFRCMLISSVMMDAAAPLLPLYQGSRLLAAISTGVLGGIGYALIYMQGSSTGGMDFITMSIKSFKPHVPLGRIVFAADASHWRYHFPGCRRNHLRTNRHLSVFHHGRPHHVRRECREAYLNCHFPSPADYRNNRQLHRPRLHHPKWAGQLPP